MRIAALLPTVYAASLVASPAFAQRARVFRVEPGGPGTPQMRSVFSDAPKAVIGLTTTSSATKRDTLGVLVAAVRSGSPAEKAGIEEGNRIASINGVSLELSPADVGDYEMAGSMSRRLTRELDKLKPGDEVELQVVADGHAKTVKVKTVSPDEMYDFSGRRRDAERATLGLSIGMNGSSRDSIGVFVMAVDDGGPAAKAGIEEGARIASINGVDLKSKRADDDEMFMRQTAGVARLEREMSKVKPGDPVELRVFYNGQFKNVKLNAGKLSDRPRTRRALTVLGGDAPFAISGMPSMPPMISQMPERMYIDGSEIGDRVRRALDGAGISAEALGRVGIGPNRVQW